jgi:hypothetical protein
VREAEESSLLEAVAREGLVKTLQAGKGLPDAGVICKVWRLAIVPINRTHNPSIVTHTKYVRI